MVVFEMLTSGKLRSKIANILILQVRNKMTESTLVNISEGALQGKQMTATSFSKKTYFAFQGIPYAQPPLGSLRFKDPIPQPPWQGVKDAVKEAPPCPQKNIISKGVLGNEKKSLALNVFTPQLPSSSQPGRLPVIVWIHGGGFTFGSGNSDFHDPDYWMEKEVVIVTCNYRLGALGFLSLGTSEVPGNAGMKDQVMVLRWVRRNIAQFSGDPDNVTLLGESAGAASVHYHMLSPMSKGLFHRAIMMSGTSLNEWAFSGKPVERSYSLGKLLGCASTDPQELLAFLQTVPAMDIVKVQNKVITEEEKKRIRVFPFLPSVEPKEGEGERFLTEHPRTLLRQGKVAPVPLIIGCVDGEGYMSLSNIPHSDKYFKEFDRDLSYTTPQDLALLPNSPEKIRQYFFKDKAIGWDTASEYFDYIGDVYFYLHIQEAIRLHVSLAVAPVYCYNFTFKGQFGYITWLLQQLYPKVHFKGVSHADDVGYIFKYNIPGPPQMSELPVNAPEVDVVQHITGMWHQFAATGNPNMTGLPVQWEPAVKDQSAWRNHLELSNPVVMRNERIEKRRMGFWDSLMQPQSKL